MLVQAKQLQCRGEANLHLAFGTTGLQRVEKSVQRSGSADLQASALRFCFVDICKTRVLRGLIAHLQAFYHWRHHQGAARRTRLGRHRNAIGEQ